MILDNNENKKIKTNLITQKIENDLQLVNEQLETIENNVELNYAKKDDVAKISSGTPLFASSTTGMTDTTRNYVNTTDGYLYMEVV